MELIALPAILYTVLAALLFLSSVGQTRIVAASALAPAPSMPGVNGSVSSSSGLVFGFYASSCPQAESIIQRVIQAKFAQDMTITPALLRMFFHDCFINGCDASILIDSTHKRKAEKDAGPNLSVRGFDLIDEVKVAVEAACPGVVSCADIIALSVRDAIALAGGPSYEVACGRRDGLVSSADDAASLPSPSFSVDQVRVAFEAKGLTLADMVVLLGAHTVGSALCGFFSDRVFSFRGTGEPDPAMNATLAKKLGGFCPNPFATESDADPPVALDQATPHAFDTSFFRQLQLGNAILQIDQELTDDPRTASLIASFSSSQELFFADFVRAISLMGALPGNATSSSQVRRHCRRINGAGHHKSPGAAAAPPPPPPPPPSLHHRHRRRHLASP